MRTWVLGVGLMLGLLGGTAEAQNWPVVPLPTTADLHEIDAGFSNRYVVGDGGFVAVSDGGLVNWAQVDIGTSADLLDVVRQASSEVWITGTAGTTRVLRFGVWEPRDIPNSGEDFVIFSRSSGWAFSAGSNGSIYRSTDLGVTWDLQTSGTANAIHDGNGFVDNQAYSVGDNGTILKTTNGGLDWVQKPSGTTADLHAFIDASTGVIMAAGENGTILRSTDGGESWNAVASGTTATIYDLSASQQNGLFVLAVGENGTVLKSTDNGASWCLIQSETTVDLYACDMALNSTFLVAGAGGYMAVTTNDGGGCADPAGFDDMVDASGSGGLNAGVRIAGPWPLPLGHDSHVQLSVDRSQRVRVDVLDAAGRVVESLLDAEVAAEHPRSVRFDAASWPAGVYFIRAISEGGVVSKKVVALR
ncbi:MAG: T9SS type A sorting domain-containing protein [Candidatus Eisenbacteria bacterium]|uniref:T9SS type A sorting domain-containing protein n=1 Tax=Eiseniibacteriota bacterium TaxID=2212470 RepID=A0A956NFN9_UNCEI|nr:T9SS type A sorting domain-containing protein [Candidatus Eisenbacteria bacterium]